jgi:hypothetical protein
LFFAFLAVIAATLLEALGSEWLPQIDAAWRQLRAEGQEMVAQSYVRAPIRAPAATVAGTSRL